MFAVFSIKRIKIVIGILLLFAVVFVSLQSGIGNEAAPVNAYDEKGFIKWVDFSASFDAMERALKYDTDSGGKYNWIELLAYTATKTGGDFDKYKPDMLSDIVKRLEQGEQMADITADMKYYSYYHEAYTAILSGFVGQHKIEIKDKTTGEKVWTQKYGLKAFLPVAKGYPFSHYDDFGNSRSYGFKRKHLGNDLMGAVGTPIIAVEGGTIEAMGWNMYGGWRIGIRSHDKKRYYYYAHLRKNFPFRKDLTEGMEVEAGEVIGYLGRSGYSNNENTNNIDTPHLHFGVQLIFDESQKEGPAEIWIDVYQIVELLKKNRSETIKDPATKEYSRVYEIDAGVQID